MRVFRFQGLESERDQLFKIGLHGRTVLRDSGATMESFFGAADGRVGWPRHKRDLRQNRDKTSDLRKLGLDPVSRGAESVTRQLR